MKNILHIFLISCFSLTVISCAVRDHEHDDSTANTTIDTTTINFVGGTASGFVLTSADGTNWTLRETAATNPIFDVIYSNSKFVAVGYDGIIRPHRMESLGIIVLLEHQIIFMELPTETVNLLRRVMMELSAPLRVGPFGVIVLLGHQLISMTSPMETVNSLRWEIMEQFLPRLMEPLGIIILLEHQKYSGM